MTSSSGTNLTEAELIAELADQIVPREWGQFCRTPDQVVWLTRLRDSFNLRLWALSAYFNDKTIPISGLT